jgi:hypothetical protein
LEWRGFDELLADFCDVASARHAERKKGYVKKGFKKNGGGGRYTYGLPGDELTTIEFPDPSTCFALVLTTSEG